jgi:hypothetical protein
VLWEVGPASSDREAGVGLDEFVVGDVDLDVAWLRAERTDVGDDGGALVAVGDLEGGNSSRSRQLAAATVTFSTAAVDVSPSMAEKSRSAE